MAFTSRRVALPVFAGVLLGFFSRSRRWEGLGGADGYTRCETRFRFCALQASGMGVGVCKVHV